MKPDLLQYFTLFLMLTGSTSAEVYLRYDQQGRAYYSDRLQAGSKELILKPVGYTWHKVKTIYDGDTIKLASGLKVRLAGINTPEIEGRHKSAEPGGNNAKRILKKWLYGKQVRLVLDSETKDKYGRTLAYVFTREQQHINVELVKMGLAAVNLYPPNLKYQRQLLEAQNHAEQKRLGIWLYPEYQPKNIDNLGLSSQRGWRRLFGTVKNTRIERKFAYLEFSDQADIRIAKLNLDYFPDLDEYVDKTLEIRGWVSRRKNHYSILIRHPSALKIIQSKRVSMNKKTDDL